MNQKDFLTGLNTIEFLNTNYSNYINTHKDSKMIAIDFTKLKYINDNFGHAVGDDCLKLFGEIAKKYFTESLLIRRSGDEFVFVTSFSNDKIEYIFKCFNDDIISYNENKEIPVIFSFNCGIKPCEEDLCETLFKADITMYQAKLEKINYKYYSEDIYTKIKSSTSFIDTVYQTCSSKNFKFAVQPILDYKNDKKIVEIYSRDANNNTIFSNGNFRLLKINYMFKIIDLCNLEHLFKNEIDFLKNNVVMINVNSQTLFSKQFDFISFISNLIETYSINTSNVILSINISDYNESNESITNIIDCIKQLGFKVCLDSCSIDTMHTIFKIIDNIDIEYVKISKSFLEHTILSEKGQKIANNIINIFEDLNITPIFSKVETEEEDLYIKNYKNALKKGNYYVKEIAIMEYSNKK